MDITLALEYAMILFFMLFLIKLFILNSVKKSNLKLLENSEIENLVYYNKMDLYALIKNILIVIFFTTIFCAILSIIFYYDTKKLDFIYFYLFVLSWILGLLLPNIFYFFNNKDKSAQIKYIFLKKGIYDNKINYVLGGSTRIAIENENSLVKFQYIGNFKVIENNIKIDFRGGFHPNINSESYNLENLIQEEIQKIRKILISKGISEKLE